MAGYGARTIQPFPAQPISRIAAPLSAANHKDGLVFSLGPSYGRGRATSALGASASGPMRRIPQEA